MANSSPRLRTIVREPRFELALRDLIGGAREADEFIAAAETALSRQPECGQKMTSDPELWFLPMILEERIKHPLILYYTFDPDHVYFIHIQYAILDEPN